MPDARELRVELGCGKGRFTAETAAAEPDVLLIAVEKVPDAMVVAMERAPGGRVCTMCFSWTATPPACRSFSPPARWTASTSISATPGPASNQAKRRLTHGNFLQLYRRVLPPGRPDPLQERQRQAVRVVPGGDPPSSASALSEVTRDLHAGGPVGVMTDYEAKFYQQGVTINRCVATMVPWEAPAEAEGEEA